MARSRGERAAGVAPAQPGASAGPWIAFAAIAGALLLFYLIPLLIRGRPYPVGPDVPFYVWSSRLAGRVGLSVTDFRPGVHAVLLLVSGGTGLSALQVAGALAVSLAVSAGLAAGVLAERGLGRDALRTTAIGLATGAYTARLASGYLANLLFAALFVAALAFLIRSRRRETVLAALLLGAAGLAHGLFLAVGAGVLGGAAVLRMVSGREDRAGVRADLARLGGAALGGGAVAGAGFLVASLGQPLTQDEAVHSRDALLRRAGLGRLIEQAYHARWLESVTTFRLPILLPLAALGGAALRLVRTGVDALFGSLVAAWAAITVAGIGVGLVTARLPAGRVLNFALVLPLLGAIGAIAVGRWVAVRRRGLGRALGAVLMVALLSGPAMAWWSSHPFTSRFDLEATHAAASAADDLPPRTPLVFVIDHRGPHAAFELVRFINVIRMGLPADRLPDAQFFVGGAEDYALRRPGITGDQEHDGVSRDAFARVEATLGERHAAYLLRTFNQDGWDPEAGRPLGPLVRVLDGPPADRFPTTEAAPANEGLPSLFLPLLVAGLLGLLALTGAGWVAWLGPGLGPRGWALSPAVGAAALVLSGVAADGLGLRLASWGGAVLAAALLGSALAWRASLRGPSGPDR